MSEHEKNVFISHVAVERILIVEDNKSTNLFMAKELRKVLNPTDFVDTAYDIFTSEQYMDKYREVSLVLIDAQLPYKESPQATEGVKLTCEFCTKYRRSHHETIFVAWSSRGLNLLLCPQYCHLSIDFKDYKNIPRVAEFIRDTLRSRRRKLANGPLPSSFPNPVN